MNEGQWEAHSQEDPKRTQRRCDDRTSWGPQWVLDGRRAEGKLRTSEPAPGWAPTSEALAHLCGHLSTAARYRAGPLPSPPSSGRLLFK